MSEENKNFEKEPILVHKTKDEPETVAEARQKKALVWDFSEDEALLRSPEPDDVFKSSDSWRVFRIMSECVNGFDALATITRGVSLFGSARTPEDHKYYKAARETGKLLAESGFEVITVAVPESWKLVIAVPLKPAVFQSV